MKAFLNYPAGIYVIATLAALGIMIIIDFILGAEAEHLNAWVIVNKLLGNSDTIGDSLAIRQFGLLGATLIMLALNAVFGFVLLKLLSLTIKLIHWI